MGRCLVMRVMALMVLVVAVVVSEGVSEGVSEEVQKEQERQEDTTVAITIQDAIIQAEIKFLSINDFYLNEFGNNNLILQLDVDGQQDHNANIQSELFKLIPSSVYVKTSVEFEFITKNVPIEDTVDSLLDIKESNVMEKSNPWPSVIIANDPAAMILYNSRLINDMKHPRPVLYLNNNYEIGSEEIITTLIEAGYVVFWHIPIPDFFPADISEAQEEIHKLLDQIRIRLIAIPVEKYGSLKPTVLSNVGGIFAHQPGLFYLSQYKVDIILEKKPDSTFATARIQTCVESTLNPWYTKRLNQRSSLPPRVCSSCRVEASVISSTPQDLENSEYFMSVDVKMNSFYDDVRGDEEESIPTIVDTPYISTMDVSMETKGIKTLVFPKNMSQAGKDAYSNHYCRQIIQGRTRSTSQDLMTICEVYLAHLLREEFSLQQHLVSSHEFDKSKSVARDPTSSNENYAVFNSWRGAEDTDGSPGVSIHANNSDMCTEPILCELGSNIQDDIVAWQNPPQTSHSYKERSCDNSKYLVFMATFKWASIGSWIHQIAMLMKYAICHDRILLLPSKGALLRLHDYWKSQGVPESDPRLDFTPHMRWIHDKCSPDNSIIDCYFKQLSSCQFDEVDYFESFHLYEGIEPSLEDTLMSDKKYVSISFIPFSGSCSIGTEPWGGSFKFFRGKNVGLAKFAQLAKPFEWGRVHQVVAATAEVAESYGAFAGADEFPFQTQIMRYILRPQRWFANALSVAIQNRLSGGGLIPRPFANLHIRYGEKALEMNLVPLHRYMKVLMKKAPHIKNVFVTTETEAVFHNLTRDYPDFNFYFTRFERNTHLHTSLKEGHVIDYQMDFFMSMSNLFVSIESDFFVGTLASGWCQMINELQRTRGDGGTVYNAVDSGPL